MKPIRYAFLWIAAITIILFALQTIIPGLTAAFVLNQKALQGEIWRFLTAIFLHGSITHLFYNLFALLFFGIILERTVGTYKFLIVYFTSGILANIMSVHFYTSSLGASGAIYGILGTLMVVQPMMMVWAFGVIMPLFLAVIVWTAGDILRIAGLFDPGNVGSIAHLSGVIAGIIIGFIIRKPSQNKKEKRLHIPDRYMDRWERTYIKR